MRSTVASVLTLVLLLGLAATAWTADDEEPAVAWLATELTDVSTGETFTIAEFAGTPVLLESFAVWCPICTNQQKQVRALHEEVGDDVISIALNTDPNEDHGQRQRPPRTPRLRLALHGRPGRVDPGPQGGVRRRHSERAVRPDGADLPRPERPRDRSSAA